MEPTFEVKDREGDVFKIFFKKEEDGGTFFTYDVVNDTGQRVKGSFLHRNKDGAWSFSHSHPHLESFNVLDDVDLGDNIEKAYIEYLAEKAIFEDLNG